MCSLRDAATELGELGVNVYGISRDSVEDMGKFAKDQKLPFPLLSDPDGSVTKKFEVDMDGRPMAKRVTFVLDPKGVIRARDEGVKVDAHGKDLIELIQRLADEGQ
ncbi:MAG: peroxiredoxin [Planctomycetota bacterium]